jgi:histidyl-tRNA synthetase
MEALKSVRGMNDLLPPESAQWLAFEAACRDVFDRHGYGEIRTPIVEATALFARGIGDDTDIVEKEMYTFADRKNRSLTMRPEMTASCVRAYIQHAVGKKEPITRWYYIGPMFRYERMQTGRYRQFYQVGVEAFGIAEPTIDAEQIAMAYELYRDLGTADLDVVVNSVGGPDDRPRYRKALIEFLSPHKDALCADCQRRLETNPLRVLDCKVPSCKEIVADAPSVLDHLGEASRAHYDGVRRTLDLLGVPQREDAKLVRGLDYYTGTVFEIMSTAGDLGAQGTLVAGGRYDGLVDSLGGPATPAVGWAAGIERAMLSVPDSADTGAPELFIAARGDDARARGVALAHQLRKAGHRIEVEHRSVGVKAQLKRANKTGARYAVVLGDDELASGRVRLKEMATSEEREIALDDLAGALAPIL